MTLNVLDQLKRVPGTTNVQIFGAKDYAMRIWVRPDRLAQLRLTPADLIRARERAERAVRRRQDRPVARPAARRSWSTPSPRKGRLAEPEASSRTSSSAPNPDGSTLRLKDVARVELGSKDYDFIGRVNGKPATLVGIFLQPGANALEVGERRASRPSPSSPSASRRASTYSVPYDTTRFVEVSIREVVKTLVEAMVLVFLVVFLFLQNWRATLIPFAAVPVSLIGTFAGPATCSATRSTR